MKPRIFYTKPSITDLEVRYATDAAANGWGDKCYEYIARFEGLFREHLGVSHAIIATSSCTGAMHMGLSAPYCGPSALCWRWDDPVFKIAWPLPGLVQFSPRDAAAPRYEIHCSIIPPLLQ